MTEQVCHLRQVDSNKTIFETGSLSLQQSLNGLARTRFFRKTKGLLSDGLFVARG